MNPFAYMREWFIWATQTLVTWAMWCYGMPVPIYWLGGLFGELSTITARIAGELWTLTSWYDYVTGRVAELLTWDNILSYLKFYLDAAVNAWNWVVNSWNNVTGIIDYWWVSTRTSVLEWIAVATQGFDNLVIAWDTFWNVTWPEWTGKLETIDANLNNFFLVTLPTLFDIKHADEWWNSKFSDVASYVNTTFKEYEPFWEGWYEWKDKVIEFFTDPEEWLYKAVDRIIERFW